MAAAKTGVARIIRQRGGELFRVGAVVDQSPGQSRPDDIRGAARLRRKNGERAGHRFQSHIAEGFGNRRVEQQVGARNSAREIVAGDLAQKDRIGKLLLARAVDELRAAGADAATLWVFAANAPSIGFYEAQGWRPDGTTRTQSEFGEPEQRMRKEWS